MRARSRAYYAAHKDACKANVRAWQLENSGRVRDIKREAFHRRRARIKAQFVEDVRAALLVLRDEGRCGICGGDLEGPDFHIDHIVPVSRGGEHSYANTQLAHASCNVRKGAALSL
jgi:5-methylcytosine-specific restriction endonuclease McrA